MSRIWRAFGLKPHAIETWKLSTDPQFVDKRWCSRWTSQMQAIERTAPIMPTTPARMSPAKEVLPLDHRPHATFEDRVTPIAPATAAFTGDSPAADAL